MIKRKKILITGRIQGVGFRPTVYRIAKQLTLTGLVFNNSKGVTIELQGKDEKIDEFLQRLKDKDKPIAAEIQSCEIIDIETLKAEKDFIITKSKDEGEPDTGTETGKA